MGTANAAESVDEQLEKAHKKIEKLVHALAVEQENNGSLLEVYLGHLFEEQIRATDAASTTQRAKGNDTTNLDAVANAWRRANEMLHETAVNEFPAAQKILAAANEAQITQSKRALALLIAVMFQMISEKRSTATGLPGEIVDKAKEYKLDVVGLGKTNIDQMLATAKKLLSEYR